jgi:Uma2 family endonuclease
MSITDDNCFRLDTDWKGYTKILDVIGEGHTRVTYDRGCLELMSPGRKHELNKVRISLLLTAVMLQLGIEFEVGGSTTFKNQLLQRGLEPDDCFWIANAAAMSEVDDWLPEQHPPPDLAIEIDVSRSSMNRMSIYAALGVREVWRYHRNGALTINVLDNGEYRRVKQSPTIPKLRLSAFIEWVHRRKRGENTSHVLRDFGEWLQTEFPR